MKKLICLLNTPYSVSVVEKDSTVVLPANQLYVAGGQASAGKWQARVSCRVTLGLHSLA